MPELKSVWTVASKSQFDELRQRAVDTNHLADFIRVHNEIVALLGDLERVIEKGDPLYRTKKPGGIVLHILLEFISVTYTLFAEERVGWVIGYRAIPASWPEQEKSGEPNGKQ